MGEFTYDSIGRGGGAPSSYDIELKAGNIPGHELIQILMRNPSASTEFTDLAGNDGSTVNPTSAETWRVRSTSTNDIGGGTGARSVTIPYLDDSYAEQEIIVALNGTTPVTLNADHFRHRQFRVTPGGAGALKHNEGTIIVETAGGTRRGTIQPGFSVSQDGHYTTTAGKTSFGRFAIPLWPVNHFGIIRPKFNLSGANQPQYIGMQLPYYEAGQPVPVSFVLPQKADIIFELQSSNPGADVICPTDIEVVDNASVDSTMLNTLVIR